MVELDACASLLERELCDASSPFPTIGLVLGSGLGSFADRLEQARALPYEEIPGFPSSTVKGHAGRLVVGYLGGLRVAVLQGRFHLYEGYAASEVAFPIRALIRAGIKTLVVTNAAGGVEPSYRPGDLMLISDHLNFSGQNPLVGPHHDGYGPRFPDMSEAYSGRLRSIARAVAEDQELLLHEGVYAVLGGPSYETPAEVRALHALGAQAVGMSTVYEVIASRQMGAEVLGVSLISNHAAGIATTPLSHAEVVAVGREAAGRFEALLAEVLARVARLATEQGIGSRSD